MDGKELDLIHFQWAVYNAGYRWMEHSEITSPELTVDEARVAGPALVLQETTKKFPPNRPWRHGERTLPYRTDEARYYSLQPGTFMTFAHLEPSRGSILGFVEKYGHLGLDKLVGVQSDDYRDYPLYGEYFTDWETEINSMGKVVEAWRLARENLVRDLQCHILRDGDRATHYDPMPETPLRERPQWGRRTAMPTGDVDLAEMLRKPADSQVALHFVQLAIDVRLKRYCSLALIADTAYSRLNLHAAPQNLIGAMWLQFAVAASGDSHFKKCKMCKTYFEVGKGARRRQSLLCSDACKMRSYRETKRIALQLKAEGKSETEIARQLKANLKSIEKWIRG